MALVVGVLVAFAVSWVLQMIAMRLMQRFADLTLPEFPEWAWKVAVMVCAGVLLNLVPFGWIPATALYWYLMARWFGADVYAILFVGVVRFALGWWVVGALVRILNA